MKFYKVFFSRKFFLKGSLHFPAFWLRISFFVLVSVFVFTSCSPEIKLKIHPPEKQTGAEYPGLIFPGEIGFSALPTKTASQAISRFAGVPEGESLFSENSMKEALKGSNFNLTQFSSGQDGSIDFVISSKNLNSVFKDYRTNGTAEIISVKQENKTGKTQNIAEISINPENLNTILSHFPPETRDYIDILMAPVFTGENLTKEEYVQLIKAAYGENLAGELEAGKLNLEIVIPTEIFRVYLNGEEQKLKGNKLIIPLTEFLTSKDGFFLKIIW